MIDYFKKLFAIRSTAVLMVLSLFSLLLSALRISYTNHYFFLFLVWNLFLAFLPWFIASIIYIKKIRNWVVLTISILVWLAFFPNAPYILTDLMHLGKDRSAPIWFDLILLLSYGFAGLLYGFVSLHMIEKILVRKTGHRHVALISVPLIYLACFGIYIGRFLRWNSWDLVSNMSSVLRDIAARFINPFNYTNTWVFTIFLGTLLNVLYWSYKSFSLPEMD